MKDKYFLVLSLIFIFLNYNPILASIKEEILITVDNEIITSYDLKNQIRTIIILSNKEVNQDNINQIKKSATSNLINLSIKKIEVEKFDIQIS